MLPALQGLSSYTIHCSPSVLFPDLSLHENNAVQSVPSCCEALFLGAQPPVNFVTGQRDAFSA